MRGVLEGLAGAAAVAAVTVVYAGVLGLSNATTVSTTYLLVVLVVAATSTLRNAIATSVAAVLAFNYFFLPPVGTWTIADPQNWVALATFLAVSLIASNLSATARARTRDAIGRRDEVARLFDLSRDVLILTDSREALAQLARTIARRFDLEYVAVALPGSAGDSGWSISEGGPRSVALDRQELAAALAAAEVRLEFDAIQRTYAGHREITDPGGAIRLVPLRVGTRPIGLLAAAGRAIEPGTLDALAGVVAIGVERIRFLEERRAAELTRQREELKTAVLASIGHDLRTPLTAIKVAAANLQTLELNDADRADQTTLILSETARLSRLFESLLEMARIDAGAVTASTRPAHPSEIIAAARDQVEPLLRGRAVSVDIDPTDPVLVDPRLTAAALAHVIENAAQYTRAPSSIEVTSRRDGDAIAIAVRDHGAGISPADVNHLFDRFYRGAGGETRASGTGMGLWIARGLLAAQGGRIWAENCPDGGARFTISIPGSYRDHAIAHPAR